jgi:Ca2+-binding RTX toxin-like protein
MAGGECDDLLVGGLGNDILSGGFGDDVLIGNEGNDLLRGNQNEDLLIGGSGEDTMLGQSGIDRLADGVAANEGDETSLLALWTEWSGPSSGLLRIYTNAGGFTTDGDADFLSGGGAIDAINFGAEDGDPLQSGDLAF